MLHTAHLKFDIVSGPVNLAVREQLPVDFVDLILGNDLGAGIFFPTPIVTHMPNTSQNWDLAEKFPCVFSACVVIRAQAQKFKEIVDLSNYFIANNMPKAMECILFLILMLLYLLWGRRLIREQLGGQRVFSCCSEIADP